MRNKLSTLVILILTISALSAEALMAERVVTYEELFSKALNLDLFVYGSVSSANTKLVSRTEYFSPSRNPNTAPNTIITEITIEIKEIIIGTVKQSELSFVMEAGKIDGIENLNAGRIELGAPAIGDIVLVGLSENYYGKDRYTLRYRNMIFKHDQSGWTPYLSQYATNEDPIQIIKEAARIRDLEYLYEMADAVCLGVVTKYCDILDESNRRLRINVLETFKGNFDKSAITIDASDLYSSLFGLQDVGYEVLLFLKSGSDGYAPLYGTVGYYKVEGEHILKNHRTPLKTTLTELRKEIENVYSRKEE